MEAIANYQKWNENNLKTSKHFSHKFHQGSFKEKKITYRRRLLEGQPGPGPQQRQGGGQGGQGVQQPQARSKDGPQAKVSWKPNFKP